MEASQRDIVYRRLFKGRDTLNRLRAMSERLSQGELEAYINAMPHEEIAFAVLASLAEEQGHDPDWWKVLNERSGAEVE